MYTEQEIKDAGLDDFRVFLREVWAFLGLPEPTPMQYDIARWLQHGPQRGILQAFRGVGKSWITVAFVLWQLLLDPQKKIMVVSASQNLADDFSKFCKQLIHGMPILQHLAPRRDQRDSAISFDVGPALPAKDPSVKSVGLTGQLTGSRADIIVADDIEIPKNSYTHLLRERVAELVKEFDALLKPEADARIIYLGTPQIEQSLYRRLEDREYVTRIWPAEIPENLGVYRNRIAPYIMRLIERGAQVGDPTDPQRFDKADLLKRKASYGLSGYALQFMLDTNPSDQDKHPLKLHNLLVMDVDNDMAPVKVVWSRDRDAAIQDLHAGGFDGDVYFRPVWKSPELAKFSGTVMAVDPSGSGSDETAYAIIKCCYGSLYLVDVGGFTDGFAEQTLKVLAARAGRFGVTDYIDEKNYGGGMFTALMKPHLANYGIRVDEEWNGWSRGMKEHRICDVLEPVTQSHKLIVDRRVIEEDLKVQDDKPRYSFVQQFTRMARVKGALPHDDRVEAVAMAVQYWQERLSRDTNKAYQTHKDELKDQALRQFVNSVFTVSPVGQGGSVGKPTYRFI